MTNVTTKGIEVSCVSDDNGDMSTSRASNNRFKILRFALRTVRMILTLLGWLLAALGLTLRIVGWSLMVPCRLFRALAAFRA